MPRRSMGWFSLSTVPVVAILGIAEGHGGAHAGHRCSHSCWCHLLFVYLLGAILPTGFLWDRLIY
jgi:hypothetical protein